MIKHIVQWTFAEEALGHGKAENVAEVVRQLNTLRGLVPGMGAFEAAAAQADLEASHDVCLYSEFDDVAALQAYVVHPAHQEVARLIKQVVTARVAFDYDTAQLDT